MANLNFAPSAAVLTHRPLSATVRCLHFAALASGATLYFSSGIPMFEQLLGDIQTAKPNLIITSPALLDKIHADIFTPSKSSKDGKMGKVFTKKFEKKKKAMADGRKSKLNFMLKFGKISKQYGGRLEGLIVTDESVSDAVHEAVQTCLAPVYQAYGISECWMVACQQTDPLSLQNVVGPPINAIEAKLVEAEGFSLESIPPQGEIHIRGPALSMEYRDSPTAGQVLYHDQWFATGDIGEFRPDGSLAIIDIAPPNFEIDEDPCVITDYQGRENELASLGVPTSHLKQQ
eukprot:TRINITY_DN1124_c0_g1_i1.p1 TRINITY_DN1124_c0_g1~~TRINITY_DN1124_c0_g1_i1.p1  ORF type:complete len:289 (-),score=77.24 TRINITY_DN1124_c0_g1_i1:29-895(-)